MIHHGTSSSAVTEQAWPRVADFSTHFSGPMASRALTHLGADVVKVENPRGGDGNRGIGNPFAGATDVHHVLNAGTRSISLDRHSTQWPVAVAALARWADVVIVGARPADARRRGIDATSLLQVNPQLVHCSITGYGDDGPWAALPAHGLQPDVMAGLVQVSWERGYPEIPEDYQAHGTALAGIWAALGIQAGLLRRLRGQGGQVVSVSIWEAALSWMWRESQAALNGTPSRPGFQQMGSRYRMYACADGRALLVCPTERKYWARFVDALGLPADWRDQGSWERGSDYGRGRAQEAAEIAVQLQQRPAAEWEALLARADVPVAMVRTVAEAATSEHAAHVGAFAHPRHEGTPVAVPLTPVSVLCAAEGTTGGEELARRRRSRGRHLTAAPRLGEHTTEVLGVLGLPGSIVPDSGLPQFGDPNLGLN